jgi:cob(I)alamin adenosyltransferase
MSDERYRERQQRVKDKVDARVAAAGRARHRDRLYRQR